MTRNELLAHFLKKLEKRALELSREYDVGIDDAGHALLDRIVMDADPYVEPE